MDDTSSPGPDFVGSGTSPDPDNPESGSTPPEGQGGGDPTAGGATVGQEGAPIGFGATVGGAEPIGTSDPEEAKQLGNAPGDSPGGA